ncbi:MAG: septal ring lytic transglycosylase RlpA family protein [Sulfurimonas sp.]|jgi:rare lipoprotein A
MNKFSALFFISLLLLFDGCSTKKTQVYSDDSTSYESGIDKKTYTHPTMKPYVIRGIKYFPTVVSVGDEFRGNASWYGPNFNGKLTCNGETYDMYDMTAAHKTLPMNTIVKVTNTRDGSSTVVRINDRGPFVATRIIDLSKSAAEKINVFGPGTAPVTLKILGFYSNGKKTIPTEKELKNFPQTESLSGFALQIAAFSNINGAIKTQEKYDKTDGYRTVIKDVDKGEGRLYRVYLKGFKSEQEARDYIASSSFNDAFIVRED